MHSFSTLTSSDRSKLSNHIHHKAPAAFQITPVDVPADTIKVHRKASSCACGGSCPSCAEDSERMNVQTKLAVSMPGDRDEQEADSIADQMVQMKSSPCSCGGGCGSCQGKSPATIQRKPSTSSTHTQPSVSRSVLSSLGPGRPLDPTSRTFFEPKLGRDLSGVRVHTGAAADVATSSLNARAFTAGHDLVFANGEFSANTDDGRRLLGHELVHWVQQGGRGDQIHRSLKVDAARSDDKKTAIPQMTPLLQKLCPDFDVDQTTGKVTPIKDTPCDKKDFAGVSTGKQKLGCCCLCTLVKAFQQWTIVVTITRAPTTDKDARQVRMTPTAGSSVPDLRYWTGGSPETMVSLPPEEGLGHELCGHAALMQARGHPPPETKKTMRTFSDIHDPTVKIQNELAGPNEMALGSTPRGLAVAGSAHRGESLRVFAVGPFAPDSDTINSAAQTIIDGAAALADGNPRQLIDIVGFSDSNDTLTTIGQTRADTVRAALDSKMTKKKDVDFVMTPGAKPTMIKRLQPAIDGGSAAMAVVEIRLAREPSGLETLPSGVSLSTTITHVNPEQKKRVEDLINKGKSTGNECHDLLITTAWT
jgi:Domain of unknown function (DUF4157)